LANAVQKEGKFESFIRCQTALKEAEMTDDSVTEVEVGILDAILEDVCCVDVMYVVKIVRWMDGWKGWCDTNLNHSPKNGSSG
jgi:hypothetical protein